MLGSDVGVVPRCLGFSEKRRGEGGWRGNIVRCRQVARIFPVVAILPVMNNGRQYTNCLTHHLIFGLFAAKISKYHPRWGVFLLVGIFLNSNPRCIKLRQSRSRLQTFITTG